MGFFFIYKWCLFLPICLCVPAEECSYWLPLYGSMCCRLAAQPHCMTQQMMTGCLKVKVSQWEPIPLTHSTFSCFCPVLFPASSSLLSFHCHLCVFLSLCYATHNWSFLFCLTAVGWWPPELDRSVCCSKRNKSFLLPPARRCGG